MAKAVRKARGMIVEADFIEQTKAALVVEQFDRGDTIRRVSIPLTAGVAESLASECMRWLHARRAEYASAIKRAVEEQS